MQDDSQCPVAKTETLTSSPVHHHAPWVGGEGSRPQRGPDGPDVSCLVGRVPGLLVWCLGVLSLEGLRTLAGREAEAWGPGVMDERATKMDMGAGLSSSPQPRQVSRGQRLELSLLLGPAKTVALPTAPATWAVAGIHSGLELLISFHLCVGVQRGSWTRGLVLGTAPRCPDPRDTELPGLSVPGVMKELLWAECLPRAGSPACPQPSV